MSATIEKMNKVIAITAPDKLTAQINAENKQHDEFMDEYERYKTNKKIYPELQMTPDAYPLMLELFEACKNRLRKLPFAEIQRQRFRIAFSYFGRSWLIVRLYQGDLRRNELHLAICLDEPNPSPDAVIGGFRMPEHWGA